MIKFCDWAGSHSGPRLHIIKLWHQSCISFLRFCEIFQIHLVVLRALLFWWQNSPICFLAWCHKLCLKQAVSDLDLTPVFFWVCFVFHQGHFMFDYSVFFGPVCLLFVVVWLSVPMQVIERKDCSSSEWHVMCRWACWSLTWWCVHCVSSCSKDSLSVVVFCYMLMCVCWLLWFSCQYLPSDWLERPLWGHLNVEESVCVYFSFVWFVYVPMCPLHDIYISYAHDMI